MTTSIGVDLGLCGAFLNASERCEGRLIVDREGDRLLEATCSECGEVAARPAVRDVSGSVERDEQWWDR